MILYVLNIKIDKCYDCNRTGSIWTKLPKHNTIALVMAARKSETDPQEMYEMMIDLLSWYYCTQMYCYEAMLQKRIVSHQTQSISPDYLLVSTMFSYVYLQK
jgi:hypothetical protein